MRMVPVNNIVRKGDSQVALDDQKLINLISLKVMITHGCIGNFYFNEKE